MTTKALALVAVLCSGAAGCSDEDLAAIYGDGKHQGADAAEQARRDKIAAQLQAMKSDTIERIQTTRRFLLEWSAQIARQYSSRESYQSNGNGASFDVPIGAYSGVGTINALVAENYNPDGALVDFGAHPRHASPMRSSGVRGWAFEPVGVMAREWTVVSSGVVSVANHQVSPPIISWITDCNVAFRFEVIGEHGAQGFRKPSEGPNDVCRFNVIDEKVEGASDINSGPAACYKALYRCANDEQRRRSLGRYYSDDGMTTLDLVSEDSVRLTTPDGAVTSYAHVGSADYTRKLVPGLALPYLGPSGDGTWLPASRVDRNGLATRYEYGGPRGSLSAVVDAHGRRTEYRRGDDMQLVEVAQPGPGGGELTYGLEWTSGSWVPPWGKLGDADAYTTLAALRIPDGRRYRFDYEPSGLLSRVTLPDGGVHAYRYGENFPAVSAPVTDYYARLDDLRVEEETVWPQGPDGPSFAVRYETYFEQGAAGLDVWQHVIDPDGTVHKTRRAYPAFGSGCSARFSGPLVEETWSGDRLLERHAYTYAGALRGWADCTDYADQRVVAIAHERDGVAWTETFEHQANPMLPGRVAANVTRHVVAGGGRQREITRAWEDRPEYVARHLLTLPRTEETSGDSYQGGALVHRVLERVEYGYDERALLAGGLAGLADVGPVRGNVTSTTRYLVPEARAGAVTTAAAFYDTGKVAREWSAVAVARGDLGDGAARRNTFGEQACSASAVVVARTALPDPGNGAIHTTETVTDCNTGLTLASRGVNGAWTCTQYDRIGRTIEVANPGDRLSAIPDGVRDRDAARCPTTGSAELGSGGRGPTRWFEYLDTELAGAARTVIHDKTGGPRGRVTTSWRDSRDREVANCIEVDLATVSSGARDALERAADGAMPAACVWRAYDHAGRLVSATTSAFQPSVPATPPRPGFDVRTAFTEYDGLGRVTRHTTAGGRETTHAYGAAGGRFATTTIPPRGVGATSVTETSVLGHVELVREPSVDCGGETCVSEFRVDALGRVVEAVEPGGVTTVTAYDGAGRIIRMVDPDRGELTAVFDENGNRLEERDARGSITYTYDALDRVTSKTYSTARPEETRVEFSYDGRDPGAPPIVVERAAWQVGAPTGTRNGLVARWARFDARGRAELEVTRLDDGSLWSAETTYGHADGTPADGGALAVARTIPHRAGDEVDTIVYRHDAVGMVRGIDRERGAVIAPIVAKMRRNAAGDVVELAYGNGIATTRAYSSDGDLVSTIARGRDGVVGALELDRDAAGNITAVRDFERCAPGDDGCAPGPLSATYTYDPRNQLVAMVTTGAARTWRYDGMRNVTAVEQTGGAAFARTITYGGTNADGTRRSPHAAGRVDDGAATAAYDYDAVGNLRATTGRPGGDLAVTWNLDNMPTEVRRSDGTLVASKHFLGESLWKRVEGDVTTYLIKDARIEVRGRELVVRTGYDGHAEGSSASPELRYLHTDQLGSTTFVTDDAGDVVYREAAWPFGETRTATGAQPPRARFNGKEVEASTGLVDFGARVYDPYLGRWWSADDDVRDGLNRYTFVGNNPVTARDPDGHRKKKKAAPASERTTQQQSTANRTAPGPNAQGPIAGFRLRVTLPEPGPYAPNAAPMAGHEYQFTCGSLNGNTLCWTNRPVYVPGAGMVQTATVTFDGKQNVVQLIPVAEPAAPDPGETAVKTGAAAWHIGFTRVRGTGASEGEGATRISIKLRPGYSISGDATSDLADRIGVKATVPYTNLLDVSVGENGFEGTAFSRNLSQSVTKDGKLKLPKTKSDWKPNLELYFQIRDSSLIQGLKRYASVCGGAGTYCN